MARYRHDPDFNQKGKVNYNAGIVSGIVELAIKDVDGVELLNNKNKGIKLYFEKEGIVADIGILVDCDYNVPSLAFKVQQSIKHNVETMTKYKVAHVDVHVQDINFGDSAV